MCAHRDMHLESEAAKILLNYGFPVELRGYEYMRCAVALTYQSPELAEYVTKSLFPKVARLCPNASASSVARGCRHAIEYAFDHGYLNELLSTDRADAYPSSALVIASLAKCMRSDYSL